MKFSNYFDTNFIFMNVEGTNKIDVIKNMISKIAEKDKKVKDRKEEIEKIVVKREMEISTAIGMGVGVPHGRLANYNDVLIAVGLIEKPFKIQVEGTNEEDTLELVFLIISDALKNKTILKIMSSISKIALKQEALLQKIKKAKTPKEVLDTINEANIEFEQKIIATDLLSPDVIPAKLDSTLRTIANRLIVEQLVGLPVVDENNNFLGEITERELIEFGMPKYTSIIEDLSFLTSGEPFEEYLLKEDVTTIANLYRDKDKLSIVDKNASIMEICHIIVNKGSVRIYVVEDGKYLGIIRRRDIVKKVLHI